ncbi:MAG: adenylate/guanylate cyclase domain-containing protein [Candidatus Thiodiazotropha sp.]
MSNIGEQYYAIVFADIVDSTRMYESLGDSRAKQLITEVEGIMETIVNETGGYVVEVIGDEVMSRYDRVSDAVEGACLMQDRIDEYAKRSGMTLSVRIGLHYGPAIVDGDRMYGDSVNIAARMAAIAQSRQIITTEQVVECLSGLQKNIVRCFDEVKVKGKQKQIVIYDLLWRRDDVTIMHTSPRAQNDTTSILVIEYGRQCIHLLPQQGSIHIGREECNQMVVTATAASRSHAVVEYNRGKFVLSDISTNGTYLTSQNQQPVYLRRESFPLLDNGKIGLGEPVSNENKHVICYHIE